MATVPSNLTWACRRGMLELDVLLGNFLNEVYNDLPSASQNEFVELLRCEDQDLFLWLTGKDKPIAKFEPIVAKIITHAKTRNKT